MNSIVKTPAVRNFATATMLTLGVLGVGACAGGSANKTAEQTQTEVISAEGAEALKAMNVETPLYSNEINKQIYDKTISKYSTKEDKLEVAYNLIDLFDVAGTFLGTAEAQRTYDENLINDLTYSLEDKVDNKPAASALDYLRLQMFNYFKASRSVEFAEFEKNGPFSAQKMSLTLDNTLENLDFLSKRQKKLYHKSVDNFKKMQNNTTQGNVKALSDLISYKVFLMDKIALETLIEDSKVLDSEEKISKDDYKALVAEFEKAAAPTP